MKTSELCQWGCDKSAKEETALSSYQITSLKSKSGLWKTALANCPFPAVALRNPSNQMILQIDDTLTINHPNLRVCTTLDTRKWPGSAIVAVKATCQRRDGCEGDLARDGHGNRECKTWVSSVGPSVLYLLDPKDVLACANCSLLVALHEREKTWKGPAIPMDRHASGALVHLE